MKMPKIVHVEPPDGPSEHEKLSAENAALMAQAASALGDAEALRTENEALRAHRDQLTEDLGSLEDRMQELLARVASEYRNGHAAGQEAAMESVAALRARVAEAETYRKFWQRYAMPPKARPSCLVCGRAPEDWPPAIQHMALPSVIVCTPCVTAARAASNKPGTPK